MNERPHILGSSSTASNRSKPFWRNDHVGRCNNCGWVGHLIRVPNSLVCFTVNFSCLLRKDKSCAPSVLLELCTWDGDVLLKKNGLPDTFLQKNSFGSDEYEAHWLNHLFDEEHSDLYQNELTLQQPFFSTNFCGGDLYRI